MRDHYEILDPRFWRPQQSRTEILKLVAIIGLAFLCWSFSNLWLNILGWLIALASFFYLKLYPA